MSRPFVPLETEGAHGIIEIVDTETSSNPWLFMVAWAAGTIREHCRSANGPDHPKLS